MIPALSIALSGMQAASTQLAATASNIANAQTIGGIPGTPGGASNPVYQPVTVSFSSVATNGVPGGVAARTTSSSDYYTTYNPDAPFADAKGNVAAPAVDPAKELVNAAFARYQFEASAKLVKVANEMQKAAIDILA